MSVKTISLSILVGGAIVSGSLLTTKQSESLVLKPSHEVNGVRILPAPPNTFEAVSSQDSATERVAMAIAESIRKQNPQGPTALTPKTGALGAKAESPQAVAQNILTTESRAATERIIIASEEDDDVVVSTKTSEDEYLSARKRIIDEANKSLARYEKAQGISGEVAVQAIATQTGIALQAMKKVTVPPVLAPLHKQQLKALALQYHVMTSIAEYQRDPVTAMSAIALIPRISEEARALDGLIKKHNIVTP